MKTKKEMLLIDPDTGAVTGLEPETSIKSPAEQTATKNYFDQKNQKMQNALGEQEKLHFRKSQFADLGSYILLRVKMIPDDMSAADLGRLIYLSTYSDYHNRLMLNEQRIMQRRDLPEVMNLKERKTRDFFREMLDKKYITEKNGELFITDNIIYRGEKKERRYNQKMKLFIKTVRDLYKHLDSRRHGYLGLIVQLIPYVNRRYNILCWNPEEQDVDQIKSLTITDVCKIVNRDPKNYDDLLEAITGLIFDVNGYKQSACSCVSFDGGYRIIFNPRLMYIGKDYHEVEVLCTFFPKAFKSVRKTRNSVPLKIKNT